MLTQNSLKLISGLFLLLLYGCSTANFKPYPDSAEQKVKSTQVFIRIPQQEIYADINYTQKAADGNPFYILIDSIIEPDIAETNIKLIAPMKDLLLDFPFDKRVKEQIDRSLKHITWLKSQPATLSKEKSYNNFQNLYYFSESSQIILIQLNYYLSSDFSRLNLNAQVSIYPLDKEIQAIRNLFFKAKPEHTDYINENNKKEMIYNNFFSVNYEINRSNHTDKMLNIEQWSKNKGEKIKLAIEKSILCMAKMIQYDIAKKESTKTLELVKYKKTFGTKLNLIKGVDVFIPYPQGSYHAFITELTENAD